MSELQVPIRIKRGVGGAPSTLLRGELAYAEDTQRLYIGEGSSGTNDPSGRPIAQSVRELTTPPSVLSQLQDVVFTSGPNDGDVLTYDGDAGEWIAQAVAAASVAWDDVTSKPSTFAPSTHASSHHTGGADAIAASDIGAAAASHSHAWGDITSGVPSTFAPATHAASHATGGADAIAPADIGAAPASHTHAIGDVTNLQTSLDGKASSSHTHSDATTSVAGFLSAGDKTKIDGIATGATANTGTVTSVVGGTGLTGGTITATGTLAVSYGTTAGTACEGNDSRLSDARTPTSHTHAIKQEISGFIESPEAKTYVLTPSTNAAMTITQLKAQTSVGTVDIELHDDGTIVTGASLADAGTTLASLASDISVSVAAGSKLALVVSDPQSSPENLAFTVHYTIAGENNA